MSSVPQDIKQDLARKVAHVKCVGIACALPPEVANVADLADRFGEESVQKIMASTGIESRRIVSSECASDLCVAAAERLITDLGIERSSIDTLIFVSQTRDYILPATACSLQARLGLDSSTAAFDVGLGCSGYVYGVWLASSLLASSNSRRVLLLVGDTISKLVADDDRSVAALFGDAGSATVLDYDPQASSVPFVLGSDGRGEKNLIVPGGGFRDRQGSDVSTAEPGVRGPFDLYMNGAEIFAFTLARIPKLVKTLQESEEDGGLGIDKYVFHQANKFMLEHLAKKIRLDPEKVVLNMKDVGNTSGVSIPLALCLDAGTSNTVSGRYLLAGFGVGYSWAGCVLQLSDTWISPVVITDGAVTD
ncbi:3-oxoacyl-ACP synthase III family protein [Pseudomonas capsici]|uniref:3-oxoacyl-ACP synthase III family protein n=1 Tax=Pseudomonas capsici TaxID=2810614 RepID=UPI0021F0FCFA|nr:ketoacyl-ACP synthase III [Pseudomonas capsici]MCV4341931.1 ketoacyl-ACP synthase III [Pseudomonas capsici]